MDADDCNYFFIGTTGCCVVLREYNETKLKLYISSSCIHTDQPRGSREPNITYM